MNRNYSNKKLNKITKWLDEKYSREYNPPIYMLCHRDLNTYYSENDKNLSCNNISKINELRKLNEEIISYEYEELIKMKTFEDLENDKKLIEESNYVHVFKNRDKKIIQYINPNTRRYHINMLFNKIIEYCYLNNLLDLKGDLIISKKMRSSFVKFCFENCKK
jgi:hypothetical protein